MRTSSVRTVLLPKHHGIPRIAQFGHYRYTSAKPGLETHFHKDIVEICYCLDGIQHYHVEDAKHQLKGGRILIVPPNTAHNTGGMPEEKGELFWIQIQLSEQLGNLCHLPHEKCRLLLNGLKEAANVPFFGGHQIKELLEELFALAKKGGDDLHTIRIDALLLQLLVNTLDLSQRKQDQEISERILLIDDFIEENLHRNIYVDELAELIQVSTGYFKSWFKMNTGSTPKEYSNRKRIEHAKKLLSLKNSVTQVAFALGFNSSQYFATVFRKYTGKSPKEFMQSLETDENPLQRIR